MESVIQPLITIAGFIGTICAIYFGMKNNNRVNEKDIEARATAQAEINMTVRKIDNNVESLIKKQDSTEDDVNDLKTRMVMAESGIKEIIRDNEKIHTTIHTMQEDSKNFQRVQ